MVTKAKSFWNTPHWEVQRTPLSIDTQEMLLGEATTEKEYRHFASIPHLDPRIVKTLIAQGYGALVASNTTLDEEIFELLAQSGDQNTLDALAHNESTPLHVQELVFEQAMLLPHPTPTKVARSLAFKSTSAKVQVQIAELSLLGTNTYDPEYDYAWQIRPELGKNLQLTRQGAAALSHCGEEDALKPLRDLLGKEYGPRITLDFNTPFLRGEVKRADFEYTNPMGQAFLQGVRETLTSAEQDAWDSLLPEWSKSVRALLEAVRFTTR